MIHIGLNSGNVIGVKLVAQDTVQAIDAFRQASARLRLAGEGGFSVGVIKRDQVAYVIDVDDDEIEALLTIVAADIEVDDWS